MTRRNSVKRRIVAILLLLQLIAFTGLAVAAYTEMREGMLLTLDHSLRTMANGLASVLSQAGSPESIDPLTLRHLGILDDSQIVYYRVWKTGDADALMTGPAQHHGARFLEVLNHQSPPDADGRSTFEFESVGMPYRGIWILRPDSLNFALAIPSRDTYHELNELVQSQLIGGCLFVVFLVTATAWTVLRAFKPVDVAAETLRSATPDSLKQLRLDADQLPSELGPFIDAVTSLLFRLDAAMDRQRQFTSDASHELRTPLTMAKTTLQAADRPDKSPEARRTAITEALRDLTRMERLIGQLLTLARTDDDARQQEFVPLDLTQLLADLAESFAGLRPDGPGRIHVEPLPAMRIRGNFDDLVRLFNNVLDNAIKHGPAGGVVTLSARAAGGHWEVHVHDQGGAIPPEHVPRLGERFFRTDDSRARATGGSGLGLSIARGIAELHGGRLTLQSSPESGTVAVVTLPREPA